MRKLVLAASTAAFSLMLGGLGVAQDMPTVGEGDCGYSVRLCYTDADGIKTCRSETVMLPCDGGGGGGGGGDTGGDPGGDTGGTPGDGGGTGPSGPNP